MNAVEPPFGKVLDDEEALSWLQNQPTGRLEVSVAELARLWGWGRTRVYRRLERWQQEGRIATCGAPGGRWLVSAVADRPMALTAAVSATPGVPVDSVDTEKSQELASKLSEPIAAGVHQAERHPDADRASGRLARSSRRSAASIILTMAALALASVGITINGWFAESMGATPVAGYLFLAVGVAADMIALAVPFVSARAWQAHQRTTAMAGWMIWAVTFCFAITAGIGFASTNITDVTMARAARVTPGVTAAQTALADAMASRDRECRGGVGRYCREREQAVVDQRQALDAAMQTVAQAADPQAVAAIKLVSWVTGGAISPSENDFGMLRLALLCLLPQLAGVLIMVGRGGK
jgi:hypothetical protein